MLFVGNNWDGTADVIRQGGTPSQPTFTRVARLNIIPDIDERMAEILTDPERLGYFLAIRQLIGEGHDQYVDDMFSSKDGRLLVVSRPSLADVIGLDLNTGAIVWRFRVDGQRSDHMAMSPDGTRVAVSASTGNVVHILDTFTGQEVGRFASGDSPHENNYSADGQPDLPRQHRARLHAGRPAAARHDEGRSPLPDRRRAHQPDRRSSSTWARSSRRPATRT